MACYETMNWCSNSLISSLRTARKSAGNISDRSKEDGSLIGSSFDLLGVS